MANMLPKNRLVQKRNLSLEKQLEVRMQILREEYRQTREVIARCQRDCGYFLQGLHRTAPGLLAYCPPDTRAMRTNALLKERRQSLSSKCGQTWDSHHLASRLRRHSSRDTQRVHQPHHLLPDAVPCSVDSEAGHPDDEDDDIVEKKASVVRVDNPANIPHAADEARKVAIIADKCALEKSRSAGGFDSINKKTGALTTHAVVPRVRYSALVRPSSSLKLLQGQVTNERPPRAGQQTGCRYGKDAYTECEHLLRNRIIEQFEDIFGPRTHSPETDLEEASPSEVTKNIQVVVAPSSSKPLRPHTAGITRVCNAAPRPHTAGAKLLHKAAVPHSSTKRVQSAYPTLRQRVKTVNITRLSSVTKLVPPESQDRKGDSHSPENIPPTFQNPIDAPTASHISPEEIPTSYIPLDVPFTSPSTPDVPSPPHTHPRVQASNSDHPTNISTNTLPHSRLDAVSAASQAYTQQAHIPFTPVAQAQPPHGQCVCPAHVTNPNQKHSTVLAVSTCRIAPRTFAPLATLSHMNTRQLVSRLLYLGVKENSRDRPKSAPTKYELSHRSLPASRQTVVGILAQIENRKAEIRAKLKMSKELQDVVKSLLPCD